MGVIIDTANKSNSKHGVGPVFGEALHGFTAGNLVGGVPPTELSPEWCDGVQMEIANATMQWLPFPLNPEYYGDLGYALDEAHINRRPINQSNPVFSYRSQSDSAALALGGVNGTQNMVRMRTKNTPSIVSGAAVDLVSVPLIADTINSVKFRAVIVQQGLANITSFTIYESLATLSRKGATMTNHTVVVQKSEIASVAHVLSIAVNGTSFVLRVTVPAAPAGQLYNAFATAEWVNVMTVA